MSSFFLAICVFPLEWKQISSSKQISSVFPASKLPDSFISALSLVGLSPQPFLSPVCYLCFHSLFACDPRSDLKLVGNNSIRATRDWKMQFSSAIRDFCPPVCFLHWKLTWITFNYPSAYFIFFKFSTSSGAGRWVVLLSKSSPRFCCWS